MSSVSSCAPLTIRVRTLVDRVRPDRARHRRTRPFLFIKYVESYLEYRPAKEYIGEYFSEVVSYTEAMEINQDVWSYIANDLGMTDRNFEILEAFYHAEIAYLYEQMDKLRRLLKHAGEWKDTIFVVTGDHGKNTGNHGLMDTSTVSMTR